MTEVLHSPSHFPSSPTPPSSSFVGAEHCCSDDAGVTVCLEGGEDVNKEIEREKNRRDQQQLSLLALIVTLFRKSWVGCRTDREDLCSMEIGWPTNVRHVAHVTFDRFNGFLGLPAEFEPEVPRRPPSASATVFGVSTESMQLSYDTRGNSVPTILLLMQRHLYAQGGLQSEGIFRINGENSQEEYVRDQLNRGVVPEGIDVHCLAGLIKAWFRELPTGVLDSLSPEQVMQCQSEEECAELVRLLPPTEAALLNWAINLMADVAQMEHLNKMNARNIAMVFAPNMTQMADPLTALMYAVQVMNFLKTLIERTLKEREDTIIDSALVSYPEPSDESGRQSPSVRFQEYDLESEEMEQTFATEDPVFDSSPANSHIDDVPKGQSLLRSVANLVSGDTHHINQVEANEVDKTPNTGVQTHLHRIGQSSNSNSKRGPRLINGVTEPIEKIKGISNFTRVDLAFERIEAWR